MATRYVTIDRDTPLLLPPDLRDWVPSDHLAHYIMDAVGQLSMDKAQVNQRGTGDEQYPPSMMLTLLIYSYATGIFSSRAIERSSYENVAMRLICADTHPDHDTLCKFRRENQALLEESFVRVLELAAEMKLLKVGQVTVSIDGSKVLANASKHAAVSYERAGQLIEQLKLEVTQLLAKAEQADSTPLDDGLTIPAEIKRRTERMAALEKARAVIAARAQERVQRERAEFEAKLAERAARKASGRRVGREPKPPQEGPGAQEQYNFTDPESRIMKAGNGNHFEQAFNAQAVVEVDSRLIVGQRVSDTPNDKEQLAPNYAAMAPVVKAKNILVDSGFYSQEAVTAIEQSTEGRPTEVTVYAAVQRRSHHRTVADLEKKEDPQPPAEPVSAQEKMAHRLRTKAGKALYRLRQQTVEPIFGIIKQTLGFRRFSLRGLNQANLEWTLVCLAYNLRRLATVQKTFPSTFAT